MRRVLALLSVSVLLTGASCAANPQIPQVPEYADIPQFGGIPVVDIPDDVVVVTVGTDIVNLVASSPGGITYVFEEGTHMLRRPIIPHDGDVFIGRNGAVLTGASEVRVTGRSDGLWYVDDLRLSTAEQGSCREDRPRCGFRHDLFLGDTVLIQATSRDTVVPGTWYYDVGANRAYLADDPEGRRLEVSRASAAFEGDANGVTVANLKITRFANHAQTGAIMAERRVAGTTHFGENWVIVSNEVVENHGVGIRAGSGSWIVGNRVHRNGQLGIASVGGAGTRLEANEISHNNFAGYSSTWEAGGTKFVRTEDLWVRHNYVHHNSGPGLWTDIDNVRTIYEFNLVEENTDTGIFHEISYDAIIRHNIVKGNGLIRGRGEYAYVYGAGILVANSPNVMVYDNVVWNNWNGVVGLQQNRGSGKYGAWELRNLSVFSNEIAMFHSEDGFGPNGSLGHTSVTGVAQDERNARVFDASYANLFENNDYIVEDASRRHFIWSNSSFVFERWQACGRFRMSDCQQDVGGSLMVAGGNKGDWP